MTYLEDKRREREAMTETVTPRRIRESCVCSRCGKRMTVSVVEDVLHAVQCPHCPHEFALIIETSRGAA